MCYTHKNMSILSQLFDRLNRSRMIQKPKTIADYRQELLSKTAREQFLKMKERGLSIPIVLL
jgi:hypothetical protein